MSERLTSGNGNRPSRFVALLFSAVAAFWAVSSHAQPSPDGDPLGQYVHHVWDTDDGLPQNSVNAVLQTRDGYLWLATQEGLVRFDGLRFRVYDAGNTPGLGHPYGWTLHEDREGRLWVGTNGGGVSRREGDSFVTLTEEDGLPDDVVYAVHQDSTERVWVGTRSGLASCTADSCSSFARILDDVSVNAIHEDSTGTLWFGAGNGLHRLSGDSLQTFRLGSGLLDDQILEIHGDRDDLLWVGTTQGLFRFDSTGFERYGPERGLPLASYVAIARDRAGKLWLGASGHGLFVLDNEGSGSRFRQEISDDLVTAIYEDRDGSLWIGTYAGGLNQLRPSLVSTLGAREGLPDDFVLTVLEGHDRTLWLGTYGGGLSRYREGTVETLDEDDGLPSNVVTSLLEDQERTLWLGTMRSGVARLRDSGVETFGTADGLPDGRVLSIAENADEPGRIWVGTEGGLARFQDGVFQEIDTGDATRSRPVPCILGSAGSVTWIGSYGGGVLRYEDGDFTRFSKADGLSSEYVVSLFEDDEGALWVGTDGGGLNRLKGGSWSTITEKDGLFDDVAYAIVDDGQGYFWMSCNRGIYRVARDELNAFAERDTTSVTSIAYGRAEGMRSRECSGRRQPSAWRGQDGRLWFATVAGAVAVDPASTARDANTTAPTVYIEQLVVDGEPVAKRRPVVVGPGRSYYAFEYTGLRFVAPSRVRFQYMLEGFDQDWVDAGTRRSAFYTHLPPGDFTFRVRGAGSDGVWSEQAASLGLRVRPFFYQTVWFYLLLAAGLTATGYGTYRMRLRTLTRRNQRLEDVVTARTSAIQEQKEVAEQASTAKSQLLSILAHDLKSPLTGVRGLAAAIAEELSEAETTVAGLALDIALSAQHMLDLLDDLLHSAALESGQISLSKEQVDASVLVSEAARSHKILAERKNQDLRVDAGAGIRLWGDRRWLRVMVDNLLSNAIKYSSRGQQIDVRLRALENIVRLEVEDQGPGLTEQDKEQMFGQFQRLTAQPTGGESSSGLGLYIVQRVAQLHAGRVWAESELGRGTTFFVDLPREGGSADPA